MDEVQVTTALYGLDFSDDMDEVVLKLLTTLEEDPTLTSLSIGLQVAFRIHESKQAENKQEE